MWSHYLFYILAISFIILHLPADLQLPFGLYALVLGIVTLRTEHDEESRELPIKVIWTLLAGAAAFIIVSRLWPYIQHGHLGFGYDIGYYKRYIELPFTSLAGQYSYLLGNESFGARIVINAFKALGLPTSFTLFGLSLFLHIGGGFLLFYLVRTLSSKTIGAFALLLYAVSLVQFEAYQLMLWKQQLGLLLFLFTFFAYELRFGYGMVSTAVLSISHRTSFIIAALVSAPYLLIRYRDKWKWFVVAGLIVLGGLLLHQKALTFILDIILQRGDVHDPFNIRAGVFLSVAQFSTAAFLYIPLGVLGFAHQLKNKQWVLFSSLFVISMSFVVLQLIFYQRVLLFLDLALLPFAAYMLWQILHKQRSHIIASVLVVFFGALSLMHLHSVTQRGPAINPHLFDEIVAMQAMPPDSTVIVTDAYFGPWVYGYSNQTAVAPGLFHDPWNYDEWVEYWAAGPDKKTTLLKEQYKKPLFIFSTEPSLTQYKHRCFTPYSAHVFEFTC